MPTSSQYLGNRGNARRDQRGGESLHRGAPRLTQTLPEAAESEREGERSPLLLLARRIREEQGTEGLGAFLRVMEPFAAPYELKNIAEMFGMEHGNKGNSEPREHGGFSAHAQNGFNMNPMNGAQSPGMGFEPNILRMMQLMNGMSNMGSMANMANVGNMGNMGNAGNTNGMMQMLQLMRMLPMLQSMGRGGGDISQIMKMMNT